MANKQEILDDVAQYTPGDLAAYIEQGVVTLEELCKEQDFSAKAREDVKRLLSGKKNTEEEDWQNTKETNTVEAYDEYLKKYQEGAHRSEAREAIKRLEEKTIVKGPKRGPYGDKPIGVLLSKIEEEYNPDILIETIREYLEQGWITIDQLYDTIREKRNLLHSVIIERLGREGIIDFTQLEEKAGIHRKFLQFITNGDLVSPVVDVKANPIDKIGAKTTEVYFWGIPASGKTCALGAIIGKAKDGTIIHSAEPNVHCQGYYYMTMLSQLFSPGEDVFKLPGGTKTDAIFEMRYDFNLWRKDKWYRYPITFIDLAGETIESMFRVNAKCDLTDQKKAGLDTAHKLLTDNAKINRKIHFFVLEYNGHEKRYKGLSQETLLTGALGYIENTGIFKTETDAVYLLITKSDLIHAENKEVRFQKLTEYINRHYKQFHNGLKRLCEKNEINGGKVEILPFSLGDVCFKNLCLFNNATATVVVEEIIHRAKCFEEPTTWLGRLLEKLRK